MKENQNNDNNSYFLPYQTSNSKTISNSYISCSIGPKYLSGDQIQGLGASFPMGPMDIW